MSYDSHDYSIGQSGNKGKTGKYYMNFKE